MTSPARAPQRLELVLLLVVLAHAATAFTTRFAAEQGLDFYHFWGIPAARGLADRELGSPYANAAGYAAVLNRAAAASDDPHLRRANRRRSDPTPGARDLFDPTATPLGYLAFAWLPRDYAGAHALFRALQLACFVGGVALWLHLLGHPPARAGLAAAVLLLVFRPLGIDVNVGNLNALQLAGFAGLAALLSRSVARRPERFGAAHAAFAAGLAAFVLVKPNWWLASAFLAACYAARCGAGCAARAGAVGLATAAVLAALSTAYFHTPDVWLDWWSTLRGPGGTKLVGYRIEAGNLATPVVAAQLLAAAAGRPFIGPYPLSVLIGAALLASLALALRARGGGAVAAARSSFADPLLAASLGIVASTASAPLLWNHYLVMIALPALFLLARPGGLGALCALSLASFAFYAGGLEGLLRLGGRSLGSGALQAWLPVLQSFAWLPLWAHLLVEVARPRAPAYPPGDEPARAPGDEPA